MNQCRKQSRAQSNALRVLGILMRRLDTTLCISTVTVEEFVDTLIESLNAKDATGFAGVVVMGELFDIFGDV